MLYLYLYLYFEIIKKNITFCFSIIIAILYVVVYAYKYKIKYTVLVTGPAIKHEKIFFYNECSVYIIVLDAMSMYSDKGSLPVHIRDHNHEIIKAGIKYI